MATTIQPSQWTTSSNPNTTNVSVGGATYTVQNADRSYSITNPGGDNNTLRFEVHPGDVWSAVDPATKNRSEISGVTKFSQGTDIHVSYNWEVEPGATNDASWLVAGQFHQTMENGLSPPFEITMHGDKMAIVIDASGNKAESYDNYKTVYSDSQNLVRGHEYAMQIDANFDPTNGYLHVVRDGVTIVDYNGPLGYSTMGDVYWKEGVYRAASNTSIAMDYSDLNVTTGSTPAAPPVSTTPPASSPVASNQIDGTTANDVLAGKADATNHIRGQAGDDSITGSAQFNDINGNTGNDTIVGKSGVGDWLLGGQGSDSINASGSTGHNVVNGNLGADTIAGGSGGDTLRGGQGDDVIHAGNGNNWISGDLGDNQITGGTGLDTFHVTAGHDSITGWHAGDHVDVDAGVTMSSITQVNNDVHIMFSNGGQMDLLGAQVNSLQAGWLV